MSRSLEQRPRAPMGAGDERRGVTRPVIPRKEGSIPGTVRTWCRKCQANRDANERTMKCLGCGDTVGADRNVELDGKDQP